MQEPIDRAPVRVLNVMTHEPYIVGERDELLFHGVAKDILSETLKPNAYDLDALLTAGWLSEKLDPLNIDYAVVLLDALAFEPCLSFTVVERAMEPFRSRENFTLTSDTSVGVPDVRSDKIYFSDSSLNFLAERVPELIRKAMATMIEQLASSQHPTALGDKALSFLPQEGGGLVVILNPNTWPFLSPVSVEAVRDFMVGKMHGDAFGDGNMCVMFSADAMPYEGLRSLAKAIDTSEI